MRNPILPTAARYLLPVLLLFSVFLLVRGHHRPGGAFVGGLVAAAALVLHALALDVATARRIVGVSPLSLMASGLLVGFAAGLPGLVLDDAFLTSYWTEFRVPVVGTVDLGTPLLFELGIYLVVVGAALAVVFPLAEE